MPCCGQGHDDNVSKAIELFDKIGRESLLLINKNRDEKNEVWEKAVKINACCKFNFLFSSKFVRTKSIPINAVIEADDKNTLFSSPYIN